MSASLFDFLDYADYLNFAFQRRTRSDRPLPLTFWTRRLRYRSPRSVAMILKKQRLPTNQMTQNISEALNHSDTEHRYFELLVQLEKARQKDRSTEPLLNALNKLRPTPKEPGSISESDFEKIHHWYHVVIKQLIATPDFLEAPEWIIKRLRGKITRTELYDALSVMLRLGILTRHPKTRRLQIAKEKIATSEDVPSSTIREHHRQMLTRALEALDTPVEQREITAKTLRISPSKLKQAKQEIRQFKQLFEKKFECPESNSVFQLNIQLFSHTEEESSCEPSLLQ